MISYICIYDNKDSQYLAELVKSINLIDNDELLLFKTEKSGLELITLFEENNNIKHYDFKFENLSFSHLRNRAKSKAKNDIVFMIDADERLQFDIEERQNLIEVFKNNNVGGAIVNIVNYSFEGEINNPKLHKHIAPTVRIFKNKYIYTNLVHENIENDIIKDSQIIDTTIIIKHIGYLADLQTNFERINRNINLMYKDLSVDPENKYLENKLIQSLKIKNDMVKLYDNSK